MKIRLVAKTRFLRYSMAALLLNVLANVLAQAHAAVPTVFGQVTASTSAIDFEVNGKRVHCDGRTEFGYTNPTDAGRFTWTEKPYLGEPLQIYGHEDRKAKLIQAKRVVFAPEDKPLHGIAIIDRVLAPQPSGLLLVRADGYPILLTTSTHVTFVGPLHSLADVHSNQWLEYHGDQRKDGVVVADKAVLRQNEVSGREEQLGAKYQYDPAAVPADAHQNSVARLIVGTDPKKLPPSLDPASQDRIDTIGERLVPSYQRELPDSDPTKIPFHFQLIDSKQLSSRMDLPGGAILISKQDLTRLRNDDQVAAYLAAGIAALLEKQQFRDAAKKRALLATQLGGGLAMIPVAGFGVLSPASFIASDRRDDLEKAEMEQRIRVSLSLLHDAGYDVTEAPKAWWLLESKESKPLDDIPIPDSAIYAYAILGSTWRDTTWEK